ncbi:MAG: hypothetical protein ABIR81_10950 [Ginsengibacter sp.]
MKPFVLSLLMLCFTGLCGGQNNVDHLIVITTDGYRWQEVFTGMDSALANQSKFNQHDSAGVFKKYFANTPEERRQLLMPFFWKTFVANGQVYGNRALGNKVNTANPYRFSYPGYNEIFTGYADTSVNSNDYPPNPHVNVLEYFNGLDKFRGNVGVFTAWEAFNRILNEERSGLPVVAAFDTTAGKSLNEHQLIINTMLANSYRPFKDGECLDVFTHYAAMEYLKTSKPKILYISYGETDEWAHEGQYRDYLNAAQQVDKWLSEIWNYIQIDPEYKNRTALLITVDHGRGLLNKWTDHGKDVEGADEIWFAVAGPGLPVKGEVKMPMQLYQKQLAQTMANLLGLKFTANHPIADGLIKVLK